MTPGSFLCPARWCPPRQAGHNAEFQVGTYNPEWKGVTASGGALGTEPPAGGVFVNPTPGAETHRAPGGKE